MKFKLLLVFLAVVAVKTASAQVVLADFENSATAPGLTPVGAAIVNNPGQAGNTSAKVAYHQKPAGTNWQSINLEFASKKNIGKNDQLVFKVRSSTKGRVYLKVFNGGTLLREAWAPDYGTQPEANTWTECIFSTTTIKDLDFDRLEVNASIDNEALADIYVDDFKLINTSSPQGEPVLSLSVSSNQITLGESVTFDGSGSYDLDGTLQSFSLDFGDQTSANTAIATHTYTQEGAYTVLFTIQDNDGKSATQKVIIYVFPVGGKISKVNISSQSPVTHKKIEASFAVKGPYTNVFDPDEVSVDALITLPDLSVLTVPCFYYEKASYQPDSWAKESGMGHWMVRFASTQTGTHKINLKLTDASGTVESALQSFAVAQGSSKGFIRQDANKQYFRHSTGEPYYPLGINAGWATTSTYTNIINALSTGGANLVRYWQVPFDRQGLEWRNGSGFYKGLGNYSQEAAAEQDSILNLCEAKNMFLQITLFQHGMFSENVDSNWADNPYNSANGGPLTTPEQYFYNDIAKMRTKKLLRYIVARWGYSPNLFAWELFNEVQFTGSNPNQSTQWKNALPVWHDEMGKYIKSLDAFDHIVSTSIDDGRLAAIDALEGVDNVQYHLYSNSLLATQIARDKSFVKTLSSVINGEYGTNTNAIVSFDDQRISIWTGIMTQVPHLMWLWDDYVKPEWANLFKVPSQYLAGEDIAADGTPVDLAITAKTGTQNLNAVGFKNGENLYAVIYDATHRSSVSDVTFELSGIAAAEYTITYYNTLTGAVTPAQVVSTGAKVAVPQFGKAIAIKMEYKGPVTVVTAVDDNVEMPLQLYPNPTHDEIYLSSGIFENETMEVNLVDVLGRSLVHEKLHRKDIVNGAVPMSLKAHALPTGIYVIKMKSGSKTVSRKIHFITE